MVYLKEIERKADKLRGNYFPIDLVSLASKVGYTPFYGSDISSRVDHKQKKIYIRKGDAITRQRFVLAHQLGHIVLHKNCCDVVDLKIDSEEIEEIEANRFASILLMPEEYFKKKWNQFGSVEYIAIHFNVSQLSANIRANNLGFIFL